MESLELSNLRVMDARDYLDLMEKMMKFGRFEVSRYKSFYSLFFSSLYVRPKDVCVFKSNLTRLSLI